VIGGFIVYHTVAVAVTERRRQFALANTVGFRAARSTACLLETLLIASAGESPGDARRGTWPVAAPLAGDAASRSGCASSECGTARCGRWAVGMPMGLSVAMTACVLALRTAFAMPTVEALRLSGAASIDERVSPRTAGVGLACIAGTPAGVRAARHR
jgi:hypothetical protein